MADAMDRWRPDWIGLWIDVGMCASAAAWKPAPDHNKPEWCSADTARSLVDYARAHGVELIPRCPPLRVLDADVMEIAALYGHDPALMWGIATDGLNREQRRELRELARPPEPPADAPVKLIPRAWWQADGVRKRIKRAA